MNIHLVDPASSYMLVLKIKPCTCKLLLSLNCERLIKTVVRIFRNFRISLVILKLILLVIFCLLYFQHTLSTSTQWPQRDLSSASDLSVLMLRYCRSMTLTGNGGLGFDSGEGALETATTSKEGSRRANYPILITRR